MHALYAARVLNLGETWCSLGRDARGKTHQTRFCRRTGYTDLKILKYVNKNRIARLPSVGAAGDIGLVMFVFKRAQMYWREEDHGETRVVET